MNTQQQTEQHIMTAYDKARRLNLDLSVHGTFAEIGAGQEVARWFFHVGHASGTVAKTISAYDMAVSDAIYGPAARYVSRERLNAMLDHEFPLLLERLDAKRGDATKFFAFANTVATRSVSSGRPGHGWMGIRFQDRPRSEPSDIVMHVNLHDLETAHEQQAIGLAGVNLIYASQYLRDDPDRVIGSLLEGLSRQRIEVDMLEFRGPAFSNVDNRFVSLEVVRQGLTDAVVFTAAGAVAQPGDLLYRRRVIVLRGSFRPITNTIVDMIESVREQFVPMDDSSSEQPVILFEMTLNNLLGEAGIDSADFLARADVLQATGAAVLVTNFAHHHDVVSALCRYTTAEIGLVLGVPALAEMFKAKYYRGMEGGILQAFGEMFRPRVRVFAYPFRNAVDGEIVTVERMKVPGDVSFLFRHLVSNRSVLPVQPRTGSRLDIFPSDVRKRIETGDESWRSLVPAAAVRIIEERRYFGYRPAPAD